MTPRSKIGLAVAVLFTVVNLAGGVVAATQGELIHASVHAGLFVLGGFAVWLLLPRARRDARRGGSVTPALPRELAERLTRIEQSVDAVAIEVERIGEGQRFMTRVFTENGTQRSPGKGAAAPIEIEAPEAAPDVRHD